MLYSVTLREYRDRPCPFCTRRLDLTNRMLSPTRDHYPIPRSKGGRRIIVCCWTCNHMKGDMSAEAWGAFMAENKDGWFDPRPKNRGLPILPERPPEPGPAKPIPYAESIMILKHGKRFWREWRERQLAAACE